MVKHRASTSEIVKIEYLDWALQILKLDLHTISNESFEIHEEHKSIDFEQNDTRVSFWTSSENKENEFILKY